MNVLIALIAGLGAAAGLRLPHVLPPSLVLLTHPGLQHPFPLPVLKMSFRPIPRVPNWVIYPSCRLLPTWPQEIWGAKKKRLGLTFIFIFSLVLSKPKFAPRPIHAEEHFKSELINPELILSSFEAGIPGRGTDAEMLSNLGETQHRGAKAKTRRVVEVFYNTVVVIWLLGRLHMGLAPARRAAL